MRQSSLARLRALVLLVAFGVGLVGQAVASPLMQMAQNDTPRLTASMGGLGGCPACDRDDSSQAPTPNCVVAFCYVSPAILPQGPAVNPTPRATFLVTPGETVQGISVRPDLAPPRPIRHA